MLFYLHPSHMPLCICARVVVAYICIFVCKKGCVLQDEVSVVHMNALAADA